MEIGRNMQPPSKTIGAHFPASCLRAANVAIPITQFPNLCLILVSPAVQLNTRVYSSTSAVGQTSLGDVTD